MTVSTVATRHEFLARLHEVLQPRTYVEVGVDRGQSLKLAQVPGIGVDPDYEVPPELASEHHLVRMASDEYFAGPDPLAPLSAPVVDLAFIDGMHLAEFALRDFLAVERFTHPASVIVFDDVFPRRVVEANRRRTTRHWTGDVYKVTAALRELRPDLITVQVDTRPTGLLVVICPDASRGGVLEGYDDWLEATVVPDPQPVPDEIISRSEALDAWALLDCPLWSTLIAQRDVRPDNAAENIRRTFAHLELPRSGRVTAADAAIAAGSDPLA